MMLRTVLAIALLTCAFPSAGAAQDTQSLDREFRIRASVGASPWFANPWMLKLGFNASVSLTARVDAVGMFEGWGQPGPRIFPGSLESTPRPVAPRTPEGFLLGGGLRLTIRERPWTHVTASSGVHTYTMGDVYEHAVFVGLAVGQAWALAEHLEIGWELTGRRVSAYEKERYIRLFDVTRLTTHDAEYFGALALTVGGVF